MLDRNMEYRANIKNGIIMVKYAVKENLKKPSLYVWRTMDADNPFEPYGWMKVASFTSDESAEWFLQCINDGKEQQ